MEPSDILNRFSYHPPESPDKANAHADIRRAIGECAITLNETLPESREKSLTITALEEAMFWANAALARHDAEGKRR